MSEFVQLFGSDDPLTSGAAMLWSDAHRLVFNCPEGTQRFTAEIRARLTKVTSYIFTRVGAGSIMGLPGVSLTINDGGCNKLALAGDAATLAPFWAIVKHHFHRYRRLEATIHDCKAEPAMRFGSLAVHAVPSSLPNAPCVTSYLCHAVLEGRFLPEKAKALGVKPGRKYASLKRGESVTADDGSERVVTPAEVMSAPDATCGAVLIADCCSPASFPDIAALQRRHSAEVHTIVHVGPASLVQTDDYAAAVTAALPPGASVRHVVAAPHYRGRLTSLPTALAHRYHLALVAPAFVAAPGALSAGVVSWPHHTRYGLRRATTVDDDPVTFPTPAVARAMLSPAFLQKHVPTAAPDAAVVAPPPSQHLAVGEPLRASFFGTGSAVPSKYRNVSSMAVTLRHGWAPGAAEGHTTVLCDVGEGTTGQWWNAFIGSRGDGSAAIGAPLAPTGGADPLLEYAAGVGVLFVSHMHADHHLGVFSFVALRAHARKVWAGLARSLEPVLIVGPPDFVTFFNSVVAGPFAPSGFGALGEDYVIEVCGQDGSGTGPLLQSFCAARRWSAAIFNVDHPASAHGCVVRAVDAEGVPHPSASFLYSGDTQPCPQIVAHGQGVSLMIHEATFADDKEDEARARRHSTVAEALRAAQEAQARCLCLFHFSQRYPKFPTIAGAEGAVLSAMIVSFDLMSLPCLSDAPTLGALTPAFQALLEEYDSWGDGTTKRLRDSRND